MCLLHDSRKANRQYLSNLGKRVGLDIEFFVAGNGKDPELTYDRVDTNEFKNKTIFICQREMVWRAFDQKCNNILMLEDDVTFTKDFIQILEQVELPDEWHGINLGGYCQHPNMIDRYYHMDVLLINPGRMWGFFGTLLNKNVYEWYLNHNYDYHNSPADNILSNKSDDHEYILTKPIILERPGISANQGITREAPIYEQAKREGRVWEDRFIYSDIFGKMKSSSYNRKPPKFLWNKK